MKAQLYISIVASAATLASCNLLQAQVAAGVPYGVSAEPHPPAIGHSQPGYPVAGYIRPEPDEELLWFRGEYLLWSIKNADIPPLVTTGSPTDAIPGALGQPGTRVLFGDELDYGSLDGARFTVGAALDEYRTFGVEFNYFFLDRRSDGFAAASTGSPDSPILARPFFDVSTGRPFNVTVAAPDFRSGRIDIASSSRLLGAEINGLCRPWYEPGCESPWGRLELLYGFRYLDLEEDLETRHQTLVVRDAPAAPTGTSVDMFDSFDARNRFYGGQAGLQWEARRGRASLRLLGKVALGATHQNVDIDGQTVVRVPGVGQGTFRGGALTQPTNIGDRSRDRFSVVPEVGAFLGYDVLEGLSLYAGYTFLYWTNIVRPGDQIDLGLNPTQRFGRTLVGEPRPAFHFRESDFWAQGLSVGAALRF